MNNKRFAAFAACLAVLAALACGCSGAPAAGPSGSLEARVDAWVAASMQSARIPGVAVGIVRDADVVYLKGFGTADGAGAAVTPQTPFHIASVSKSVTALAVLQLVEAGKLGLDDPVSRCLPEYRPADPAASGAITVRGLLNQTSGLSTEAGNRLNSQGGGLTPMELVQRLDGVSLVSRPGEAFHYSNANYALLAAIVERASGKPYGEAVRESVFLPLGMNNSAVEPDEGLRGRMASGFLQWFAFPVKTPARSTVACLNNVSTAEDMTKLLSAMLHGGSAVCPPGAVKAMTSPAAPMGGGQSYAMGLEARQSGGQALLWHPGDAPAFSAGIAMLPQDGWGVVVLQNAN